ncbi:rhodanese-like domain-containing protein [Candidatus Vampirococcus lugosii]|uniref:Rhodanese-related sulfurtransferase n=1 Tax=Candidatus Vampirococcus lugosii TaxID=2789015 RepID=A0ABS5QMY8_9BACT|nr:rhodanese-like domain-containing protein [Candidatus Vampirococcus lugosii]MBS8122349.1 Rhodanese-related sulfurtransferase [Candidatus Vampirococcus lugosii]
MKNFLFLIVLIMFLSACTNKEDNKDISNKKNYDLNNNFEKEMGSLSVLEFEQKINEGKYELIDIRSSHELNVTGFLEGAINIEYYEDDFFEKIANLDKNKKYLIYCNSGNRTGHTLQIMEELGFMNVSHLEGGIQDWIANNKKTISCSDSDIC